MEDITQPNPSIILDLFPLFIHTSAAWRGKELDSNSSTLANGIPNGKIETIPYGAQFMNNQIVVTRPKCIKAQIREKKIITSEIKNILNPFVIVFWTRSVILPSLDSICKSLDQAITKVGKKYNRT